jgi:hypothetical protein
MGKKFKLGYHLNSIVKDIINERYVLISEPTLQEKVFEYLNEIYENDGLKVYNSLAHIKEKFNKELIREAMCEMTDEEDYLAPTINKKITNISREFLKEWINEKITL